MLASLLTTSPSWSFVIQIIQNYFYQSWLVLIFLRIKIRAYWSDASFILIYLNFVNVSSWILSTLAMQAFPNNESCLWSTSIKISRQMRSVRYESRWLYFVERICRNAGCKSYSTHSFDVRIMLFLNSCCLVCQYI